MTSTERKHIVSSLEDKEYREIFVAEEINEILSAQIRTLREKKRRTQKELARELGTTQTVVGQPENPNYGRYSLSTLKRLASVLDVGLMVRFVPFGELVDRAVNLDSGYLAVPSFSKDSELHMEGSMELRKRAADPATKLKIWRPDVSYMPISIPAGLPYFLIETIVVCTGEDASDNMVTAGSTVSRHEDGEEIEQKRGSLPH